MTEYQAQALVEFVFMKNGARGPGFPSIVGAGENSCILHYITNRKPLESHDLMVVDIGAEYHGYTADVTRTMPVNGKYSPEQRKIYELVQKAQQAGVEVCKPGVGFREPHKVATEIISKGLVDLGIIKEAQEVRKYFMHGTSHYLGLDVHDPGTYELLEENMVITVEPGIYIAENSDCDPKWWNIGVRIEDDILITATGYENLSTCVPRNISEIEKLMQEKGKYTIGGN
jgi:Xaa-Pro aminopeptidase